MSTHPIRLMTVTAALSLLAAPALAQSAPAASNPTASAPTSSVPATSQPSNSAPSSAAGEQTPPATSAAPSASTGANANASVPAQLSAGLTVKDNTGASIGQVASVDTDSKTGQKMATIKMGSDSFRLPADRLALDNGAATVNLTLAQIQAQLHPKK
ncbi:MAG TPA: hypothetical protein VGG68_09390 [Caulobacteraceae bacterium]|jgi:hypothetical protein